MSWAYCAPKSTTRTRSWSASPVARDMTAAYRRVTTAPAPDAPQGPADRGAGPGPGSGLPEQRRCGPRQGREFDDETRPLNDLSREELRVGSRLRSTDEET